MLLHTRQPMVLWWGPEQIQFYNDAYLPNFRLGEHPRAMGQRARDTWPQSWALISPTIERVMSGGAPSAGEDTRVPFFRNGKMEETYWTYSHSPIFDEQGHVGGVLVICTETTDRVLAARREQAARREAEIERDHIANLFRQAPAGICILSLPELVFEIADEQYCRFVGKADLVGKPLLEAMPELRGQEIDESLHGLLQTCRASSPAICGSTAPPSTWCGSSSRPSTRSSRRSTPRPSSYAWGLFP